MANTSWRWNYFTLESLSRIKCSICNRVYKPDLRITGALRKHLEDNHKNVYENLYSKVSKTPKKRGIKWDPHYDIISSDKIRKPYIKCKHCKNFIPMSSDIKPYINSPKDLNQHLKNAHKIDSNWKALENWIYGRTMRHREKIFIRNQVIKVDKCEVCKDEIGAKNAIMFVKHLIKKHRDDPGLNIPWDIIPKELRPSDVTVREDTTLSSDIADRQNPSSGIADRQGSTGVFTESTQSSSKRKEEVSKEMSELHLDYDTDDSFHDINTGDSQGENIMEIIETLFSSTQSMANVHEDGSQINVPSTQPPDPRDIPSTSSGKRRHSNTFK